MNKKRVDEHLKNAVIALKATGIVEVDKTGKEFINKTYRGQISTFGASVSMGSILSAVACFAGEGAATVDRVKLMAAVWILLKGESCEQGIRLNENVIKNELGQTAKKCKTYAIALFDYVKQAAQAERVTIKNDILECAVALKLAMNLFELKK